LTPAILFRLVEYSITVIFEHFPVFTVGLEIDAEVNFDEEQGPEGTDGKKKENTFFIHRYVVIMGNRAQVVSTAEPG